jgi:hypothetical protein
MIYTFDEGVAAEVITAKDVLFINKRITSVTI